MRITTTEITLGAFLKFASIVETGGQAKALILAGSVRVNGSVERRRGRQLRDRDEVIVPNGERLIVSLVAP